MNLYGITDIGRKRESNQDVFYTHKFDDRIGFAIVCDGMGGQSGGNIASDMTCAIVSGKLLEENIETVAPGEIKDIMIQALSEANIEVYKKSNLEPGCKGMGTTAILAVVADNVARIAHVGDSRLYLFTDLGLHQVTRDHSLVQELLEQGKISEEEVRHHPNKNMITRAIGVGITVDIDYLELLLDSGSKLLLCTDGLTNMLTDTEIYSLLRESPAQEACHKLIAMANEAGGADNITVAIIE